MDFFLPRQTVSVQKDRQTITRKNRYTYRQTITRKTDKYTDRQLLEKQINVQTITRKTDKCTDRHDV